MMLYSAARTLVKWSIDVSGVDFGGGADLNIVDARSRWTVLAPLHESLQSRTIANSNRFDASVGAVSHPTCQPQTPRLSDHGVAKPHTLDVACDPEVQCRQLNRSGGFQFA